jgi:hypothetical protein
MMRTIIIAGLAALAFPALAQDSGMTFFVTSVGPGSGANLGGLAGADQHCLKLAEAAGAGSKTWRAYLSTQAEGETVATNARDRIGKGPWQNAKGEVIAKDLDQLHGPNSNVNTKTALTEKGDPIAGRADPPPVRHDILTGTRPDGNAFSPHIDMTCGNWTKSGADGSAMLGHHDRAGPTNDPWATSWNSSHPSTGCSQDGLRRTGGDALLYCFATN